MVKNKKASFFGDLDFGLTWLARCRSESSSCGSGGGGGGGDGGCFSGGRGGGVGSNRKGGGGNGSKMGFWTLSLRWLSEA